MKHFLIVLLTIYIVSNVSQAQEYVRLMEEQNANFYEIQQSFYDHWEGKSYEKGKGWKQFKRWEWFMEPRVYPTGRIINPAIAYEEHLKFEATYNSPKGAINNKNDNWIPIGPDSWNTGGSWSPGLGRINAVTVDPNNSNILYVGSPAGGCWKSVDAGNSWTPLSDNLASLGVSGIAIDPTNSNTVYIATGDGDGNDTYSIGVMKSIDGGATWNSTGLNWSTTQSRVMRKIISHPTNGNILWVAASNGIWKTIDAGVTWVSVLSGSIRDIELNPLNPNTIFACTNTIFYKSNNGGDSFTNVTNGVPGAGVGRFSIAVTASDTNYIYLLATNSSDNGFLGMYRSTDAGVSFTARANTPNIMGWNTSGSDSGGQGWYDLALAVSPTNRNEIYTGGVNVWKSTNGGSSFSALTKWNVPTGSYGYVHADIHTLDFYGNTLFCGSDGGIFRSTNNGSSWSDITFGIQHSQFYRLGTSVTNSGIIMAGAQDNGCTYLKNGTWTLATGADGMECVVDYSNSNVMYSSSQNGTIYKSTNGGGSFNGITGGITGSGAWVTPYTLDPSNPNTIYVGYDEIWKSTNGGGAWNSISSFSGSSKLKSLVVAPSNNNMIYTATNNDIYKTLNGGASWTNITPGLPNATITYISVHNLNPNILWVSLSGFTAGQKVYKSIDGGASWTNVSGILPNLPINCVVYENGTNNGIYVGTDLGIYYKNDDLIQWQSFMTGLPNVIVNELEIHYGSGKIRAATYGRGVWESDLFLSTTPPIAQFSSPDTNICPGICATFTNQTINLGQQWQWYFPGGTPSTSTDLNPTICYPNPGNYDVSLAATNLNGVDSVYAQNYILVQIPSTGIPLPLIEGFESSSSIPNTWTIINNDQDVAWAHNGFVGGFGLSASSAYLDNYSTSFGGERDYLVTPSLDFTNDTNAILTFDYAYSQWNSSRSDTLAIYYTTDCGVNKTLLWEKGGADLSTAPNLPIFFTPSSSQWDNDTIDLSTLFGLTSVEIMFENKSDNGNVVYIDNINIFENTGVSVKENIKSKIKLYPNPFENSITINSADNNIDNIEIYNAIGKLVFLKQVNSKISNYNLNLGHLGSGFYILKISSEGQIITKSLIKR